jgi:hypothetical protein
MRCFVSACLAPVLVALCLAVDTPAAKSQCPNGTCCQCYRGQAPLYAGNYQPQWATPQLYPPPWAPQYQPSYQRQTDDVVYILDDRGGYRTMDRRTFFNQYGAQVLPERPLYAGPSNYPLPQAGVRETFGETTTNGYRPTPLVDPACPNGQCPLQRR